MSKKVAIIDYGMSNTLSVSRAVRYCGAEVILTDNEKEISNADYLILPGVGAFQDGMRGLEQRNVIAAIREFVRKGKPFLGVCLGMQMLFDSSEEFGHCEGLKIIPGDVLSLPKDHKLPHISWNQLILPLSRDCAFWSHTILDKFKSGGYAYFVHSFYALPRNEDHILALTPFHDFLFPSVVKKDNIYGVQFHPEKSGPFGLDILKNFLSL